MMVVNNSFILFFKLIKCQTVKMKIFQNQPTTTTNRANIGIGIDQRQICALLLTSYTLFFCSFFSYQCFFTKNKSNSNNPFFLGMNPISCHILKDHRSQHQPTNHHHHHGRHISNNHIRPICPQFNYNSNGN